MLTLGNMRTNGKVAARELLELICKIWVAQDKLSTLPIVRILEFADTCFHPSNGVFEALCSRVTGIGSVFTVLGPVASHALAANGPCSVAFLGTQ